jgi:hypothetical protein
LTRATHVSRERERDGGSRAASSSSPSWSMDYGMAWHGPMDLPAANHLAAYFRRKPKKKGGRRGAGEIDDDDERVWIDGETRQHDPC